MFAILNAESTIHFQPHLSYNTDLPVLCTRNVAPFNQTGILHRPWRIQAFTPSKPFI
jgi:hypothetical protein